MVLTGKLPAPAAVVLTDPQDFRAAAGLSKTSWPEMSPEQDRRTSQPV